MKNPTSYDRYKKGATRRNILMTLKVWGGKGVYNPEGLMSHIDYEVQKLLAQLRKEKP